MKKATMVKSELICFECGNLMPISRKSGKLRKKYHIKDLYCFKCNIVTKHIELKDGDRLKKELEFNQKRNEEEELIFNLLQHKKDIKEENKAKIKTKLLKKEYGRYYG